MPQILSIEEEIHLSDERHGPLPRDTLRRHPPSTKEHFFAQSITETANDVLAGYTERNRKLVLGYMASDSLGEVGAEHGVSE